MFICEISGCINLVCQKLGSVGPVQRKIKFPSPYMIKIFELQTGSIFVTLQNYFVRDLLMAASK